MNSRQRRVLRIAAAVIVAMLLFPPFHYVGRAGTFNEGYGFLLASPHGATVDIGMLLVQWVAVVLVSGILWFLMRDKG
jgi:hypothetical protein